MASDTTLMETGLGHVPPNYFREKSGRNYRFHVAEDVVKAGGGAPAEHGEVTKSSLLGLYGDTRRAALYVHMPWCVESCTYCHYWGKVEARTQMRRLVDAEVEHLRWLDGEIGLKKKTIPSIYFGGGTPTVLPADLLEHYLELFAGGYGQPGLTEVCCEASVSSLTSEKIDILRKYVTRLSLGVQTFSDRLLKSVARSFTASQAAELIQEATRHFASVNIDLIYGLQAQTMGEWLQTVETAVRLNVPSITLYRLEIRVPLLIAEYEREPASFPDEVTCRLMLHEAKSLLRQAGYRENLVGWFVKAEVRDTVVYRERWARQTPCIAFGPGVHNYGADYFFYNTPDKEDYIERVRKKEPPVGRVYRMNPLQQVLWFVIAQWKSNLPVSLEDLARRFERSARLTFEGIIEDFVAWRLLTVSERDIMLTEGGRSVLEWMIGDMLQRASAGAEYAKASAVSLAPTHLVAGR